MTYSRDSGGQALGPSASSTIRAPSRLEGQMEDPEEWNVPSLSLFRVSLDDYPSHRPPGGGGGPVGPREQAGTTMPLLGPYHIWVLKIPGWLHRGAGALAPQGPAGPGGEPWSQEHTLKHSYTQVRAHTRGAQCHRTHGRKGKRNLEG